MNPVEKKIIKTFLEIKVPYQFFNSVDKDMFDCFLKGHCSTFLRTSFIDKEELLKIENAKKELTKDVDFKDIENVIYFDYMRLVISILKKYV